MQTSIFKVFCKVDTYSSKFSYLFQRIKLSNKIILWVCKKIFGDFSSFLSQCPRTDLNKRFLPKPQGERGPPKESKSR